MTHNSHTHLPFQGHDLPRQRLPERPEQGVIVPPPGLVSPGTEAVSGSQARHLADLSKRTELIRQLGLPTEAHPVFDEFAEDLARRTGFHYGFVNLFLAEQTFIGLHQPPPNSGYVIVGRTMSREHGWCPEVVARKKALPLHDVHASPRFSGNHVVDAVGIRAYFGAPLIHVNGTTLGTVCVIDPESRPLTDARRLRDLVIDTGNRVMRAITASAPTH